MSLPSFIALMDIGDSHEEAPGFLLADFEQAYRAFARDMASSMEMDLDAVMPAFVGSFDVLGASAGERGMACVLAWSYPVSDSIAAKAAKVAQAAASTGACEGVYSIAVSSGFDAPSSDSSFGTISKACDLAGVPFLGGILLGGGALYARCAQAPRMGTVRHKVSEAVDALAHAVMAGEGIGIPPARLTMPRFLFARRAKKEE